MGSNVCLTVLPAVSADPGKHESCPIRMIFREDARVAIRQGHAALTRVGRVRDCDVSNPLVNLVAVTPTGVVSEKRGKPLRSRTFGVVSLHGGIRHAANLGWREEPWGRGEHGSRSPHGGDAGASAIDSAVTRRDGWQVLRFGGLKQPSIVDAEGGEAVPMGVRGCQVYRV